MKNALFPLLAAALFAASSAVYAVGEADAIVSLLNSRSSGSPRLYAASATAVAEEAARGKPLQQFLVAVLSTEPGAPRVLQLDDETRKRYLEQSKDRIKAMAEGRNNPLAWYLLSLESNDMVLLERAASLGNVQALNALGTIKLTRVIDSASAPSEEDKATLRECFGFFVKAADMGDANALNSLGVCYQNGYGCDKDEAKAFESFKKAAEQRHPEAVNNLGRFYREGIVVEKDLSVATKCFATSAAMGDIWGQLNYATALMFGEGVPKNERRAVELLETIAKKGSPDAMEFLSKCYGKGAEGLKPDPHQAAVWMVRARAARGDKAAEKWLKANGELK